MSVSSRLRGDTSKSTTVNKAVVPTSIDVNDKYVCIWKSGQKFPAEVVAKRRKDESDRLNDSNDGLPQDYEYYIHYINFDRRLDEWISIDRFDFETPIENNETNTNKKRVKRKHDGEEKDEKESSSIVTAEQEHEEITKVKNIQSISFGRYEVETWYYSPYPDDYCGEEKLYICERCLKYMIKPKTLERHKLKCDMFHPPGQEIYREKTVVMYEVDGKENKLYCQNLCLLSKLFLDHKTLYYDVDPFLFYVLCEIDYDPSTYGELRIVGYFSKEKNSQENYNLACILTFPPYQRMGYGKLLISISYEITKREGTTGSPEKPLSDLGKISYRSYWTFVIMQVLDRLGVHNISTSQLSKETGVKHEDVISTMHSLNLIKYWKGQHVINISEDIIQQHMKQKSRIRQCDPSLLTWQPHEKSSSSTSQKKKM